jgi:hypothetical protein
MAYLVSLEVNSLLAGVRCKQRRLCLCRCGARCGVRALQNLIGVAAKEQTSLCVPEELALMCSLGAHYLLLYNKRRYK